MSLSHLLFLTFNLEILENDAIVDHGDTLFLSSVFEPLLINQIGGIHDSTRCNRYGLVGPKRHRLVRVILGSLNN